MTTKEFNLSVNFKQELKTNVINRMFPLLNSNQANILYEYLIEIVELVIIKNNIFKLPRYETYLIKDSYKDLIGLLFLLFPYIDTNEKTTLDIRDLNEIYVNFSKDNKAKQNPLEVNQYEPKFMFSNTQYNRIDRSNLTRPTLINFKLEFLEHNFMLLKETIINVSNKLYINWANIYPIPYDPDYFTKLNLYKSTYETITNHQIHDYMSYIVNPTSLNRSQENLSYNQKNTINQAFMYSGLEVNDIYNTIRYNLYDQVYGIKWLLYDIVTNRSNEGNTTKLLMNLLEERILLTTIKQKTKWNQITNETRTTFINSWTNFTNLIRDNQNEIDINIMRYFTKFFNTANFYNEQYAKEGYIRIKKEEYTKYKKSSVITRQEYDLLFKTFLTIRPEWAYEYILDSLTKLTKTWYGQKISMSPSNYYIKFPFDSAEAQVSYKNIYNFAKSLVSFTKTTKNKIDTTESNYIQYPKLWKSLGSKDRKNVLARLNFDPEKESVTSWFNIQGNLKLTNGGNINVVQLNEMIHANIMENLATIIFETMTFNGILSQFKLELNYKTNLDIQANLHKYTNLVNKSYYFITNKPFNQHFIEYKNNRGDYEKTEYLKYMTSPSGIERSGNWNNIYALNWVSQISFYHKYLNNRIIYVTGGTGVGKSTQVPKLLLYSLKMLDYNYQGKIMCTQPRIPPTKGTADTISSQLGVPILKYNPSTTSTSDTDNYYVQYRYAIQEDSHAKKTNDLNLIIVTDGILYEVIKNNPLLKKQIGTIQTTPSAYPTINYDITGENEQDILIVDEAHEHNSNMDMILTLAKNSLYYNNSLKLVIISATMDDDEPRYRRYYREINDNRIYPFNMTLTENALDRINVDRRIHIFPPSVEDSTPFPITDIYDINPSTESIVDLVVNLITTKPGDILLFQPGTKEIKKMVSALNAKLPANAIALPYHGKMGDKKTIIEKLTESNKKEIRYPKNVSFDKPLSESDALVPYGTYDRVVIVATNLAEASITIGILKYVIETGTQKIEVYDSTTRISQIKLTSISESSRKQRRGRVGRKSPGTVYYTYPLDDKKNVRINYDIATTNIYPLLYDLLKDTQDTVPIFNADYDINDGSKFNNIKTIINDPKTLQRIFPGNLSKIIIQQYTVQHANTLEFIDYIGNPDHYDYKNNKPIVTIYKSGFTADTVNDYTGTFYIIHPDELDLVRNIFGQIVDSLSPNVIVDKVGKKIIKSRKMEYAWNTLAETNAIYMNKVGTTLIIEKTKFGALFNFLHKTLRSDNDNDVTIDDVNTIMYGMIYDTLDDIIKIIPMMRILQYDIRNLIDQPNKILVILNKYRNNYGDLIGIFKICTDILNNFGLDDLNNLNEASNNTTPSRITSLTPTNQKIPADEDIILAYKRILLSNNTSAIKEALTNNPKLMNKLLKLQSQSRLLNDPNTLSQEERQLTIRSEDIFSNRLNQDKNKYEFFCKATGFNQNTIKSYIEAYLVLHDQISTLFQNDKTLDNMSKKNLEIIKHNIEQHRQINSVNNREVNIIKTFISGRSYNLFKNTCSGYISCFSLQPTLYKLPVIKANKKFYKRTFLNQEYLGSYLLSLNPTSEDHVLNMITNVTPVMIQNYSVFTFRPTAIIKTFKEIETNIAKEGLPSDFKCDSSNYKNSLITIKDDMLKNFNTKPYYLLMDINQDDAKFKEILVKYINEQKKLY